MGGGNGGVVFTSAAALALSVTFGLMGASCAANTFTCDSDSECVRSGVQGYCSSGGGCYFEDPECESGYAWDKLSPLRPVSTKCAIESALGYGSPSVVRAIEGAQRFSEDAPLPQTVGPFPLTTITGTETGITKPGFVLQPAPGEESLLIAVDPTTLPSVPEEGALVALTLTHRLDGSFLSSELAPPVRQNPELAFDAVSDVQILEGKVRLDKYAVAPEEVTRTGVEDVLVGVQDEAITENWSVFPSGLTGIEFAADNAVSFLVLGTRPEWEPLADTAGLVFAGCRLTMPHGVTFPLQTHRNDFPILFRAALLSEQLPIELTGCPEPDLVTEIVITELGMYETTDSPYFEITNRSDAPFDLEGCLVESYLLKALPGVSELTEVTLSNAVIPAHGMAVLASRGTLEPTLLDWLSEEARAQTIFVNTRGVIGVGAIPFRERAGLTITCNGELKDRVVISAKSMASFGQPLGLDPNDLDQDNLEGFRWCYQTTSYGAGIGTPGAPNDPCD